MFDKNLLELENGTTVPTQQNHTVINVLTLGWATVLCGGAVALFTVL